MQVRFNLRLTCTRAEPTATYLCNESLRKQQQQQQHSFAASMRTGVPATNLRRARQDNVVSVVSVSVVVGVSVGVLLWQLEICSHLLHEAGEASLAAP